MAAEAALSVPHALSYGVLTRAFPKSRDMLGTSIATTYRDVLGIAKSHAVPFVLSQNFHSPFRVMGIGDHAFRVLYDRWTDTADLSPVRRAYIANSYLGFMSEPMTYYSVTNRPGVDMVRGFRDSSDRPVYQALLTSGEMRQVNPEHMLLNMSGEAFLESDWNMGLGNLAHESWNDILTRMLFKHAIDQYEEAPDRNLIYRSISQAHLDSLLSQSLVGKSFWFTFSRQYAATFSNKRNSEKGAVSIVKSFGRSGHDLSGIVGLVQNGLAWHISSPDQISSSLPEKSRHNGIVENLRRAWELSHPEVRQLAEFELDTPSMSSLITIFMENIRNGWIEGISPLPENNSFIAKFEGGYPNFRLSPRLWNETSILRYNLCDL